MWKKRKKKKTTESGYQVLYLCDGRKDDCNKGHCYKAMGDTGCRHTSDIRHAENFHLVNAGTKEFYFENQKAISGCQSGAVRKMLRKIYQELVAIRKELQATNKNLGPKTYYLETHLEQIKGGGKRSLC